MCGPVATSIHKTLENVLLKWWNKPIQSILLGYNGPIFTGHGPLCWDFMSDCGPWCFRPFVGQLDYRAILCAMLDRELLCWITLLWPCSNFPNADALPPLHSLPQPSAMLNCGDLRHSRLVLGRASECIWEHQIGKFCGLYCTISFFLQRIQTEIISFGSYL